MTRPKKIAIIGGGNIGTKVFEELSKELAADKITLWNRSPLNEEKSIYPRTKKPSSEKSRFEGFLLGLKTSIAGSLEDKVYERGINKSDKSFAPTLEVKYTADTLDESVRDADIVIMTAGVPREEGESRMALLAKNAPVIDALAESVRKNAPNATVIIASNPVDTLTHYFAEKSGLPKDKIMGLSGVLDSARLRLSIAEKLGINPGRVVGAKVIGLHGDEMVPLLSQVRIQDEQPGATRAQTKEYTLQEFLALHYKDKPTMAQMIVEQVREQIKAEIDQETQRVVAQVDQETRKGGARFQPLLGTSDWVGPAHAIKKMTLALVDQVAHAPFIASSWNEEAGCYIGQPVSIENGRIVSHTPTRAHMNHSEWQQWEKSIAACQQAAAELPGREDMAAAIAVGR